MFSLNSSISKHLDHYEMRRGIGGPRVEAETMWLCNFNVTAIERSYTDRLGYGNLNAIILLFTSKDPEVPQKKP